MLRSAFFLSILILHGRVAAETPDANLQFLQPGISLTLVAEQPHVVTPTGIDVDEAGNIWVVSSHTHFRPENYAGPQHDDVVVLSPDGGRRVFYSATTATMDLELGPEGWVYLAERDRILRVRDSDGDGIGDVEEDLAILETEADYPHNGLAGLAWDAEGRLIFTLGENFHQPWRLLVNGQAMASGTGEGGVFRCHADGKELRRIAKGFWNPFGICVRSDGEIFAAENDPGARPPCRLLHIVEGGDYGYQRRYDGSPIHPFICWDGELPGTLPMLHSLGEAPCGIVPCGRGLIVGSWSDNRIDYYPLQAKGASYQTERIKLVQGSYEFRPTCFVQAADGTNENGTLVYYLADWTIGTYKIHGNGRVWKLEIQPDLATWLGSLDLPESTAGHRLADQLRRSQNRRSLDEILEHAGDTDPFIARAAIDALSKELPPLSRESLQRFSPGNRVSLLLAAKQKSPKDFQLVRTFLRDPDPSVQFEALRWAADEDLTSLLEIVEGEFLSKEDLSYRLFEAALACSSTLKGDPRAGVTNVPSLVKRVVDSQLQDDIRAFSLRLIPPGHRALKPDRLIRMLSESGTLLQTEVAISLAPFADQPHVRDRLLQTARTEKLNPELRSQALVSLSSNVTGLTDALVSLATGSTGNVQREALRSLRFAKLTAEQTQSLRKIESLEDRESLAMIVGEELPNRSRPPREDLVAWKQLLQKIPGDAAAGKRLFFHSQVARCSQCHRHSGRGQIVGPDLSQPRTYDKILSSLLQPSRDVDPQYFPWLVVTESGQSFTGIMLRKGGKGKEYYRDIRGQEVSFEMDDLVVRKELKTSLMPEDLIDTLTMREISDLIEFLMRADEH